MLLRENIRHTHNGKTFLSLLLLTGLEIVGFSFLIFSQTGEFGELGDISISRMAIGIGLIVVAMAAGNL